MLVLEFIIFGVIIYLILLWIGVGINEKMDKKDEKKMDKRRM